MRLGSGLHPFGEACPAVGGGPLRSGGEVAGVPSLRDGPGGLFGVIDAVGAVRSIVHVYEALPVLPAASCARVLNVCDPSARPE